MVGLTAIPQIPENVQLRKEVILGLIKSSSVFISYLSAAALDKMHEAGNKTLNAQHVLSAFKEMGFPEEYASQLRKEYNGESVQEISSSSHLFMASQRNFGGMRKRRRKNLLEMGQQMIAWM